jgi:hypothetical protein
VITCNTLHNKDIKCGWMFYHHHHHHYHHHHHHGVITWGGSQAIWFFVNNVQIGINRRWSICLNFLSNWQLISRYDDIFEVFFKILEVNIVHSIFFVNWIIYQNIEILTKLVFSVTKMTTIHWRYTQIKLNGMWLQPYLETLNRAPQACQLLNLMNLSWLRQLLHPIQRYTPFLQV